MNSIEFLRMRFPTIELTEPGYQPIAIQLEERWNTSRIVGIGRKANGLIPVVAFRDPPQALSRIQITLIGIQDSSGIVLWVRDGGPNLENYASEGSFIWEIIDNVPALGPDGWWKPSTYGTWIEQQKLSPWSWTELKFSNLLTFGRELEYPMLAGYSIRYIAGGTAGTDQEVGTVSFSAVEVWRQESMRASKEGTMLLTIIRKQLSNVAVIQEIDSTAELVFGYDPGKLQEAEGTIALQDQLLHEQHNRLSEMVGDAATFDRAYVGNFTTVNMKEISITLRRRIINNEPAVLFAWVAINTKATPQTEATQSRQDAMVTEMVKFANRYPWIAALVGVAIAVTFFLLTR